VSGNSGASTANAAPASTTHDAGARVEPALKPKTPRAATQPAARPALASPAAPSADADWETF
jgi:hypothetical protein